MFSFFDTHKEGIIRCSRSPANNFSCLTEDNLIDALLLSLFKSETTSWIIHIIYLQAMGKILAVLFGSMFAMLQVGSHSI